MRIRIRNTVVVVFLIVLLIGAGIAFYQVQRQQELRGRASTFHWASSNSASAVCSSLETVFINVSFSNNESSRSMTVIAKDQQSSQSTDLGIVAPGKTVTGTIDTKLTEISAGKIEFTLAWADNTEQKDTVTVSYDALDSCPAQQLYCTDTSRSTCMWDELPGTTKYNVTVTDVTNGDIISSQTVDAPATKLEFPSKAGNTYQCTVSAVNECGTGKPGKSKPLLCTVPSVTPTPTPAICQENESKCIWDSLPEASGYNVSVINLDTGETVKSGNVSAPTTEFNFPSETGVNYECKVNAVNECGTGDEEKSPPTSCNIPSPTPTTPTTPTPTTPTSDTPTPTPSAVPSTIATPTPQSTLTPIPTYTPAPTLTPVPTYTPAPTQTPYPTYTPAPTPTPYPTNKPRPTSTPYPTSTPQPTPTPVKVVRTQPTTPPQQQKAAPTMAATGNITTTVAIAGISLVLAIIGGIIFFAL